MTLIGDLKALLNARPEYDKAAAYYGGDVPEFIASDRIRRLLASNRGHFRVNHARTPVDVMVERTEIMAITSTDVTVKALIDQAWEDNDLGIEAKDVHRRAYEYGDGYLIGWADEDVASGVSLYAHDPQNVRVYYDPQRPRVKSHAVHVWIDDDTTDEAEAYWRLDVYFPDRVEQYVSRDAALDGDGTLEKALADLDSLDDWLPFVTDSSDADGVVENPFGVVPVFHFRTDRPYGRPEHKDAYGPQDIITKALATLMGSVDFHGFPQRYALTDSAVETGPTPESLFPDDGTPVTERTDEGFNDGSETPTGPGELWLLSGKNVSVGEFQPASPQGLLDIVAQAIRQMSAVTDVPAIRFDKTSASPSGESYRMEDAPLNRKVLDREAQFGVTWREVFEFVCIVNDIADAKVTVEWAPPATYTDLASWQTALAQVQAGVPQVQVLRERGYSEDELKAFGLLDGPAPQTIEGGVVPEVVDDQQPGTGEAPQDATGGTVGAFVGQA